ncbi:hypothetical protein ACFXCZ_27325 [Streptomyces sp. NPDC059396]|uniref:hypothetical protein n=1 Tax=Streptomyces sp. NPDC059396 TaxID=3346819 RepID=UPI0036C84E4A
MTQPLAPLATVELATGTVELTEWQLTALDPDHYGLVYMQLSGWLPAGHEAIARGTNHMVHAELPGRCAHAHNVNVQVAVRRYGPGRSLMTIQWRSTYDPGRDASSMAPEAGGEKTTPAAPVAAETAVTPDTDLTAFLADSIAAFQMTAQLTGLRHAQIRGYLAEHLAAALNSRPVTEYLASHEFFPIGRYLGRDAAVEHIEALLVQEEGEEVRARIVWSDPEPDEEIPVWDVHLRVPDTGALVPTAYMVTAIPLDSVYTPEADG